MKILKQLKNNNTHKQLTHLCVTITINMNIIINNNIVITIIIQFNTVFIHQQTRDAHKI